MAINEQEIQNIVRSVLQGMNPAAKTEAAAAPAASASVLSTVAGKKLLGIFDDIEDAIAAAKKAQKEIQPMPLEFREKIIANIRKKTLENAKLFAELGVEETGMGNVGHKILKHQLVAEKTPGTEDLSTIAWSGDRGLTLVEQGPFGVIGAVCPSTNPSETVICNSMGMIAAGNTVVFAPHPSAKNVSNLAIDMINRASIEVGGPENIAVAVKEPTMEVSKTIFSHKDISLLCATGGPGVVTTVLSSGKRAMGAGAGNPPVLVDETANIQKAAEDIVNGCTFDNNLPCIAEKEVIAVDLIADELIYYMEQNGCYHANKEEVEKLVNTVFVEKNGKKILNRKCVGRSAKVLLGMIGVTVGDDIRCIIFEGEKEHPMIWEELMMPILGIVRVKNVDEGIETAVLLEHGNRHSAHMHSTNIQNLTRYGKALDTAIFVKNGPSYAALGFGGEGYPTFTICSRTGEGLTSAKTFTKSRRCVMVDALCIR
ncbi:MAG: aldehyde dehydrogenase EutE [Lachnospiraceae bacterium]|nr:aldehyde dehydrogenase EutE [Lachnospiraceae bacterium]